MPTMEEVNELLTNGTDSDLLDAVHRAALNDVFINRSLAAGQANGFQRQRTLMLMVLVMALRHKALFDQFMERLNMLPPAPFHVRTDGNGKIVDFNA